jgi:hypothetical protein
MELTDYHGVPVAFVNVDEALAPDADWGRLRGLADVVRVERPPVSRWPALRDRGFRLKPQYVTWLTETCGSEEAYFSRLAPAERQKIRSARRRLAGEGLALSVRELDARLMEEFLVLYGQSVTRMRHGVAVAHEEKDAVLADRCRYAAVCVHDGAALVACCLMRLEHPESTARVRFSAVDQPHRESSMARVLYMEAARVARESGLAMFSLGKDRNLYGHIAKPGLLRFKCQLGLSPYPSHLVDPAIGYDQADLVLGLDSLAVPAMLLSYPADVPAGRLRLEVYSHDDMVDLRPFSAKFPGTRLHVLRAAVTSRA